MLRLLKFIAHTLTFNREVYRPLGKTTGQLTPIWYKFIGIRHHESAMRSTQTENQNPLITLLLPSYTVYCEQLASAVKECMLKPTE